MTLGRPKEEVPPAVAGDLEQRIREELHVALCRLRSTQPMVTVFGSARVTREEPSYAMARHFARALANAGFGVITGGGPGIMEAANRGAREAGATSFGASIVLPNEQSSNEFLDQNVQFNFFFTRKLALLRASCGFACFPGGFGTADELFEALTLIQTEKLPHFPIVLLGTDAWSGLMRWLEDTLEPTGAIEARDRGLLKVCNNVADAVGHFKRCHENLCKVLGPGPHYPA